MSAARRIKRLAKFQAKPQGIGLTSLMDVFTILVFFLLVNSGTETLKPPGQLVLPESIVEEKPRETVVIYVNTDEVLVQGEPVVRVADVLAMEGGGDIVPIMERLASLQERVIGVNTATVAESDEVTILADKSIPFAVLKQIMSTCTAQGYTRISLAVIQKDGATAI